jgi:hypothetical protein
MSENPYKPPQVPNAPDEDPPGLWIDVVFVVLILAIVLHSDYVVRVIVRLLQEQFV